jgi:hypothetical protein
MQKKKLVIKKSEDLVPVEIIQNKTYLIRGCKVMLDKDLADLYRVSTYRLNEQVKRNISRFPEDFMFQLTMQEHKLLISQIAISKKGRGGRRYLPYVFTEQGVAMLSSVLNSQRAVQVNIQIMRIFTRLRELMISHKDLARKIEDLEGKFMNHDKKIVLIFNAIKQLLTEKEERSKNKGPLGFVIPKQ